MIDRAIELKKDQPRRSEETINQFLRDEFQETLPKATLYRHLKQAGATRLKLGVSQQKVRRRWTRDQTNALWVGDFEDGPYVFDVDRVRETHLCAFVDCHSRYAIDSRYYYRENFDVLIDSLLRGWGEPWSQPSIVCGQRENLSRQRAQSGLRGIEHQAAASRTA